MKTEAIEKIENVNDLCDVLQDTLIKLRSGKIGIREANATANIAGKILKAADLQIQYSSWANLNNTEPLKLGSHDE